MTVFDRVLALATEAARVRHMRRADADGFGVYDGHTLQFDECPHEDCAAVRLPRSSDIRAVIDHLDHAYVGGDLSGALARVRHCVGYGDDGPAS